MEPKFTAHLFICTNDRGPDGKRESCGPKGSEELKKKVKAACKAKGFPSGAVRINGSGCLDQCERGITAVLYPEGKWFLDLEAHSVDLLVEAVEQAVKRG
ncbi:MAG: (2Fe-2S) ferredoxin domain-containing protein [Bdellovibrionota bacterium]